MTMKFQIQDECSPQQSSNRPLKRTPRRLLGTALGIIAAVAVLPSIASAVADPMIDTTFGGNNTGKVTTDNGAVSSDQIAAIALQSDGKIVVAGTSAMPSSDFSLARYNSDGTIDSTFGGGNIVHTHFFNNEFGMALAIQSDGKIVVVGQVPAANLLHSDFGVVRYTSTGQLDTSFNSTGTVSTDLATSSNEGASAVAIQSDGKIVVGGTKYTGSGQSMTGEFALVRYDTTGQLDTSFNSAGTTPGIVINDLGSGADDGLNSLKIQADGKIVVAGYSNKWGTYDFAIARYTTSGGLDMGFGSSGIRFTNISGSSGDGAMGIAIQSDGKIVAAGYTYATNSSPYDYALVRYDASGTTDSSFGTSGIIVTSFTSTSDDGAQAVAIQADGKIVAVGYTNMNGSYDFSLARYTSAGVLDSTFGTGGIIATDIGTNSTDQANGVAIQGDGKIVAAGYTEPGNYASDNYALVRYHPTAVSATTTTTTIAATTTTTAAAVSNNAITTTVANTIKKTSTSTKSTSSLPMSGSNSFPTLVVALLFIASGALVIKRRHITN